MPITNAQAVEYGLIVMYAMDMYRESQETGTLAIPKRLTEPKRPDDPGWAKTSAGSGWNVAGYVFGDDMVHGIGPFKGSGKEVCYGLVLQSDDECVVAIRGTDGFVEWLENLMFLPTLYRQVPAAPASAPHVTVEQGFSQIYETLTARPNPEKPSGEGVALAAFVAGCAGAARRVTIAGHSLGAALATLLALDLAGNTVNLRLSACLFASPKVGNQALVDLFDRLVPDCRLFNYVLDVVPHVPFGPDYATLRVASILSPSASESRIRFGPNCSHHVICYCAMLDYERVQAERPFIPSVEQNSADCILGPNLGEPSVAKSLAALIGQR